MTPKKVKVQLFYLLYKRPVTKAHKAEGRKERACRKHLILKEVNAHFDVSSHAVVSFSIFES